MADKFVLSTAVRNTVAPTDIDLSASFNFTGTLQKSGAALATESYSDTAAQSESNLRTAAGALSAALSVNSQRITSLATPTDGTDAATKAYADSLAAGLDVKPSVVAATTANITLSNSQTIDGVAVSNPMRVLVKDQSTASQNGIYTVVNSGAWTRVADLAAGSDAAGAFVFVEGGGPTNEGKGFVCTSDNGSAVVGTDALVFTQFSGGASYTAGDGIAISGGAISVKIGASSALGFNGSTELTVDEASGSGRGTQSADHFNVVSAVGDAAVNATQSTSSATPWTITLPALAVAKLRECEVRICARSTSDATKCLIRRVVFGARRGASGDTVKMGSLEVANMVDSGGIGAIACDYTPGTGGSAGTDAITLTGIATTNIEWNVSVILRSA